LAIKQSELEETGHNTELPMEVAEKNGCGTFAVARGQECHEQCEEQPTTP